MPTNRTYGDACGIARALDVVGERWALLVIRELLLGPQRFSDLRAALPGVSSNLLTDRLAELTARGVIERRRLAPPAASWVYELTDWGRELEPIVLALGGWGLRVPLPAGPRRLSATSALLFLRGSYGASGSGDPDRDDDRGHGCDRDRDRDDADPRGPDPEVIGEIVLDDRAWGVSVIDGHLEVTPTPADDSSFVLTTSAETLTALVQGSVSLDAAVDGRTALVSGEAPVLEALLAACA